MHFFKRYKNAIICTLALLVLTFYARPMLLFLMQKSLPRVADFNALVFIAGCGTIACGMVEIQSVVIRCRRQNHWSLWFRLAALAVNVARSSGPPILMSWMRPSASTKYVVGRARTPYTIWASPRSIGATRLI